MPEIRHKCLDTVSTLTSETRHPFQFIELFLDGSSCWLVVGPGVGQCVQRLFVSGHADHSVSTDG